MSWLGKLSFDQFTTGERSSKNISPEIDNPLTHYKNYDIDTIDDSAPLNIEENEFLQQTRKLEYAESHFCNHLLAFGKVFDHNWSNQILSILCKCVQFLPKRSNCYQSMKKG